MLGDLSSISPVSQGAAFPPQFVEVKPVAGELSLPAGRISQEILDACKPQVEQLLAMDVAHQKDGRTNRMTREYGYSYFKLEQGDHSYHKPPEFLQELGNQICQALEHPARIFTNVIVSLYEKGYHLEPHIDVSLENATNGFYFSEEVYGIIIEADEAGRLYFISHCGEDPPPLNADPVYAVDEKPGTVFCLQGPLRHAPFHHAVSTVTNRRISVTFRQVFFQ